MLPAIAKTTPTHFLIIFFSLSVERMSLFSRSQKRQITGAQVTHLK
jgi:hypothetical protein